MLYDTFTFFNELDLLEIRLNELNEIVDKFVLVEATLTHQGKLKPLYFKESRKRFRQFENKIIHIIVDQYPDNPANDSWIYENHQRNMIAEGLKNCQPDDNIIISDIDEIPRAEKIKNCISAEGIKIFKQRMFYYFINCINATRLKLSKEKYFWTGSVMMKYKEMTSPQDCRNLAMEYLRLSMTSLPHRLFYTFYYYIKSFRSSPKIILIDNGGWHFSFLGGAEQIVKKIESFSHTEYNNELFKDSLKIEELINSGKDIFNRGFQYKFIKIDETFPEYIQLNKNKYPSLIKNI
jgi:beta-1,4-mannosyl-glycoprotein beta-1,4-N-acetylglucosaminyltransferase